MYTGLIQVPVILVRF